MSLNCSCLDLEALLEEVVGLPSSPAQGASAAEGQLARRTIKQSNLQLVVMDAVEGEDIGRQSSIPQSELPQSEVVLSAKSVSQLQLSRLGGSAGGGGRFAVVSSSRSACS